MRQISVLAAGFLLVCFAATAQCDTKTKWTASTTEFLKSSGDVQSKPGTVTVITGKENFLLSTANGEEEMKGSVTDYTCNWKDSLNGSISFKSDLTDKQGKVRHATISIESKDGKSTILLAAAEEETKIRLPVDSYETVQ